MVPEKVEKIVRLVREKEKFESLIEWHRNKCFRIVDVTIEQSHPTHSLLIAVFQDRLKYIEGELEGIE